jgi:FkbM family methyltransferase
MIKGRFVTLKRHVYDFVSRNRRNAGVRLLAGFCDKIIKSYENSNYDVYTNGEYYVLKQLSQTNPKVVFDVGANVGDWALMVNKAHPNAAIHCFEIVPSTFEELREQSQNNSQIILNKLGLSDREGSVEVRYFPENSTLSTTLDYPHSLESVKVECSVTTGDLYVKRNGIEHIDLLKIDVEGAEHLILKGFKECFENNRISIVQFEYGYANILSRFLLRDHYEFFTERGYRVGKIYPNYIDFKDYELTDENFIGPNYLAVHSTREDLIKLLSPS